MLQFETVIDKEKNFTAADLICKYGKENHYPVNNYYGSVAITICGKVYGYSYYTIIDNGNGKETVIVSLALKSV